MIYCRKCGSKLKEGQNICPRCKADQEKLAAKIEAYEQSLAAKKKKKKKIIAAVICAAAVVVLSAVGVGVYILTRPEAIDISDYLVVEFSGTDGEGTASYSFDYDAFYEDHAEEISFTDSDLLEELTELVGEDIDMDKYAAQYLFENYVSGTLSPEEGLSNGDYVSFLFEVDEDGIEEIFGIEVTYSDQLLTVSGLDDADDGSSDDDSSDDADDEDSDEDSSDDTDEENTDAETTAVEEDADDTSSSDDEETEETEADTSEDEEEDNSDE